MERAEDLPIAPWTPPTYEVLEGGKVAGAEPGSVNNWNRWGSDDQIGTANLCTPERVNEAARLIRTGKRFSLALPIGRFPTLTGRPDPTHFFTGTAGDAVLGDSPVGDPRGQGAGESVLSPDFFEEDPGSGFQTSEDHIILALQYTTQLDGFGVGYDDALFNGYWAGVVTSRNGARRLGMHKRASGYVGRGVLLDVARHLGVERLEDEYRIGPDVLDATAEAQNVVVRPGDVVLVRTGYLGWWLGADQDAREAHERRHRNGPGLSAKTIPWLAEHDVSLVAIDYLSIEVISSREEDQRLIAFHLASLRDLGLGVGETFDLDELAADCDEDGVYEFFIVAVPLPIQGGCASPMNPIVIK